MCRRGEHLISENVHCSWLNQIAIHSNCVVNIPPQDERYMRTSGLILLDIRVNGTVLLTTLRVHNKIGLIWLLATIYIAHFIKYSLILFENKLGLL